MDRQTWETSACDGIEHAEPGGVTKGVGGQSRGVRPESQVPQRFKVRQVRGAS